MKGGKKMKITFKLEDYILPCSFEKCKKESVVNYISDGKEIHLCEEHLKETVEAFQMEGIETNFEKNNKYFAKQKEQKKISTLKLSDYEDNYK